uniref:Tetratricopeptide repeat-containing protein n=1 Tax=Pristionchus pacificus TaxID=54126 RepID=A0A2A6CXW3_PRIPA|eukprot:PDM83015.1 Tetratricopeptide repeat-containing protein [Pristionchus pacificus]
MATAHDPPISHSHIDECRRLEQEGILAAEKKELQRAIELFTKAIEVCPIAPSAYNNRAQALQLSGRPEGEAFDYCPPNLTAEAFADLEESIRLSGGKGRSACQAFTQRAMIYRLRDDKEAAKADFSSAAALGSPFARMQLAMMNPYAAMCNAALAKVMGDLKGGQ